MIQPIKPSEVIKTIPDEVIAAFNEMIAKNWKGTYSSFTQDDVIKIIINTCPFDVESAPCRRAKIFENGWLDVEPIYQKAGWSVEYDKPCWGETGPATFKFTKGKGKHKP